MSLSTLRIAWRNLGRNRRRTAFAVGAIALGQFTLVTVNGLMAGTFDEMMRAMTGPLAGHVQIQHREWREERAVDLYLQDVGELSARAAALPGVRAVSPRIYAPVLSAYGEKTDRPPDAEPAVVVGVDVAVEAEPGGLLDGRPEGGLPGGRAVLVGNVLANRLGVGAGDLVAVIGQDAYGFPVSDLYRVKDAFMSRVDLVNTMGVVMALPDARELFAMPDEAHQLLVHGYDHEDADRLAEAVRGLPAASGLEVLSWREAMPELANMLDLKGVVDVIFVAIVFVAAAAGIANTAIMSTYERTHEFGMLLAVGARPRRVLGMVLVESIVLGLIGVALGSALGVAVVLVTNRTGINYAALGGVEADAIGFAGISFSYVIHPILEARHVVFGVVAVTLTSVLASMWPAASAARLEPVEAMRA